MSGSTRPWPAGWALALACASIAGEALAAAPACPSAGWTVVEAKASPETRPVKGPGGRTLFIHKDPITATADLTQIKLAGDQYDTLIQMRFTPEAAKRLHDTTTDRSGMRIAFVSGDRVLSAITWTGPYGMDAEFGVQISLGRAVPQDRAFVEAIQGCLTATAK